MLPRLSMVVLVLAVAPGWAHAASVALQPVSDRFATDDLAFDGVDAVLEPDTDILRVGNAHFNFPGTPPAAEFRAALEFDLSGIATGSTVNSAMLTIVPVLTSAKTDLQLHGGQGDGAAQIADMVVDNVVASGTINYNDLTPRTFDVTAFLQERVTAGDGFAMISLRNPTTNANNPPLFSEIGSRNQSDAGSRPVLAVDFDAPVCGDGVLAVGAEECDDGNAVDTDACRTNCVVAVCGDTVVWNGVEECDDGDDDNTDACPNSCQVAKCGDGVTWAGEEACDDGNAVATDACLATCDLARCGDGVTWAGVEACDDGNASNTDACLDTCVAAGCGDGFVGEGVAGCEAGAAN